MKFLIDAQLPPKLAIWIRSHGQEANHLFEIGLAFATDSDIWMHAKREGAIIITKDRDFVDRWLTSDDPASLLWIRKRNCSAQVLVDWFATLWPEIKTRLEEGEKLIELRA